MPQEVNPTREIRIALVLYGGVSLAVYENGVTRCFFDLVKRRGVFKSLLDMLDASAAVDVVAGASAGGINGLLLAAALESGAEFAPLASLWRRIGDVGLLLGDSRRAAEAESFLDGERFHKELIQAFEAVCKSEGSGSRNLGEMDVFVTGTDLDGHARRYRDGLGADIADKEHRVVFHLQHRPERKSLGLSMPKDKVDYKKQAQILGALARITASFPLGFPPVYGKNLPDDIQRALSETAGLQTIGDRTFIDGGVLDNKPFGPALRAIFYRMPTGIVDRRLFYVEPDPVPFLDSPKPQHSPVEVGIAALTSIPGHEGIGDDLEKLLEHNQRIGWFAKRRSEILNEALAKFRSNEYRQPEPSALYLASRIEAVARFLVLKADGYPSALDFPKDRRRVEGLEVIRKVLDNRVERNLSDFLDPYDIGFHLRRALHLLYGFYQDLEGNKNVEKSRKAMLLVGRIVKALKLILESTVRLRDQLLKSLDEHSMSQEAAEQAFDMFIRFLASDQACWGALQEDCKRNARWFGEQGDANNFLTSEALTKVANTLREVNADQFSRAAGENQTTSGSDSQTILALLADLTKNIVLESDGNLGRFECFAQLDQELYPLEFAGGIYELDEVECVRISPKDAQIGLSEGEPYKKITGDQLAHFSAFLCRDWRSNDILQGRFDGICQIIRVLLDDEALERILVRCYKNETQFAVDRSALPFCPDDTLTALKGCWEALYQEWKKPSPHMVSVAIGTKTTVATWSSEIREKARKFREQLIRAAQEDAFFEDIETIGEDRHFQAIKFGQRDGVRGVKAGAPDDLIEADARCAAREDRRNLLPGEQLWQFQNAPIGAEEIVGPGGRVPGNVATEYGALAYLFLWNMLRRSLAGGAKTFLELARVRLLFRTPMAFMYHLLTLLRRDRVTAFALLTLTIGVLLGIGAAALYMESWVPLGVVVATLLVVMKLIVREKSEAKYVVGLYRWIPARVRGRVAAVVWIGTVAVLLGIVQVSPLPVEQCPSVFALDSVGKVVANMVWSVSPTVGACLEIAALTGTSQAYAGSWEGRVRDQFFMGLGLDYVFLLLYPLALSFLCSALGGAHCQWPQLRKGGAMVSWAVLVATPVDAIENIGQWMLVEGGTSQEAAWLYWRCTLIKWGLIGLASLYMLLASLACLVALMRTLSPVRGKADEATLISSGRQVAGPPSGSA